MRTDRKIWPVVALLLIFLGLTGYFARRIQTPTMAVEVGSLSGYLALFCGAAAVVAVGVALVMLWAKRKE
jgi:hypothetical protein